MSGSMDLDDVVIDDENLSAAASIIFFADDIGPRGMTLVGDGIDYQKTVDACLGRGFSHPGWSNRPDLQFFYDEANFYRDSYKTRHDMPHKELQWKAPAHKPGETPRGTKPNFIGGKKKSKQQRAAAKARRKQR